MADRVLVIANAVKLGKATQRKIEAAGYVVVRGDPSQFRELHRELPSIDQLLYRAARDAIALGNYCDTQGQFARNVVKALDSLAKSVSPGAGSGA